MAELILGGARSGKSALALRRAAESGRAVVWIATAEASDDEMAARIARHRAERPAHWQTVEETLHLADALRRVASADSCAVVDCLTLWLTNLMMPVEPAQASDEAALVAAGEALCAAIAAAPGPVVLVGNEIGLGVIPMGREVRQFVDALGRMNQAVAAACERVTLMAAGLPLVLKGAV
jgi:adenosylcobinamide kinase/adenosylcobinamide-phosphate guanylyltransferase